MYRVSFPLVIMSLNLVKGVIVRDPANIFHGLTRSFLVYFLNIRMNSAGSEGLISYRRRLFQLPLSKTFKWIRTF